MNKILYFIFISTIATISTTYAVAVPSVDATTTATTSVSVATDTIAHDDKDKIDKDKQLAEDKAINKEVDDNYSEIVNLKDCPALAKRIQSRVDKIAINTEKESKNIDNLVASLTSIASDTASNTMINLHIENIQDKFGIVSTTSDKYIKELKSIDINKCKSISKSIKAQVQNTKVAYKTLLVADNDLKKYIKIDVKQTLIDLKQVTLFSSSSMSATSNMSTTTNSMSTTSTISIASTTSVTDDSKSLWGIVKGLFK